MRKVLLMSGELSLRGTSLYTVSLARELKLRGHRVALLGPGGLFEGVLQDQRIPVLHAPVHGTLWRDLLYLKVYLEAIRDWGAEILHVQHQDLATLGAIVSRRAGLPFAMTCHAQVEERLRFPFHQLPRVIAVSEDVRQSLVTSGQVPREKIDIIPGGVATSLSSLEESAHTDCLPVVGTVNRIDRGRGIDDFLRAARKVLDRGIKAWFLIVGEGPAESETRALARQLGLMDHLTIALPRARIADLFRPMDVFVSTSRSEGHGIFLLSAMAEARPVIAAGVGGVLSFLRDGENGLIVKRGDVDALTERIVTLLQDREFRHQLGREGFRFVRENFPLHSMVERTTGAYEAAIAAAVEATPRS